MSKKNHSARDKYKPGNWSNVHGPVYEHESGARLHMQGMLKTAQGDWVSASTWPHSYNADLYIRAQGGSRRRGLMAWARSLITPELRQGHSKPA